jgi:hypothetical protein
MACYIFLKSLRSLEEFRKNRHVKIPPKSPSTNFQSPIGPSSQRVGRVFAGNTFSILVHAFPSRPPLPRLSVNRAPSVRCVFPTAPADPSHFLPSLAATPRRPTSDLVMPDKTITPHLDSPQSHPLTSHQAGPSSMALKPLTPTLTAPATPPRRTPGPYKRRAPSPSFTAPLPAPISLSPRLSSPLTERRRLAILHRHRPASSAPPESR